MKSRTLFGAALSLLLMTSGCGHLDVDAPVSDDRVLTGMINYDLEAALPADAVITVRVIDLSNPAAPMNVLGETTIEHPGTPPVPFRVEYRATDQQLMHQVVVDARISFGGKLHFHTVGGHPVTLGNFSDTHVVKVEPTSGRW